MLPFLKKDRGAAGISVEYRKPDNKDESNPDEGLEAAAKDLVSAVSSSDHKAVAAALRAAFEILDSQPHEEYDHDSDDSYTE